MSLVYAVCISALLGRKICLDSGCDRRTSNRKGVILWQSTYE